MSTTLDTSVWNILDVRAIWIKEFASALSEQVPTLGWLPHISSTAILRNGEQEEMFDDPCLRIRSFPLQRGFAKFPVDIVAHEGTRTARRILQQTDDPSKSPLICTAPHYAAVGERWPGPVVYYVTDRFVAYGDDPGFITSLDKRMCGRADWVCPNSQRIADYLIEEAHCPEGKVQVIANATREGNLLHEPPNGPMDLPLDVQDMRRPIAGVIGNLAANTDWLLLQETIMRTPWLSWIFVGPTDMPIADPDQNRARQAVKQHGGRVRFLGPRRYALLRDYARAIDVAVLPYRKSEPTYSGSSTRFYEHLAACRPMIATHGFEELLHKEPLLRLVDGSDQTVAALETLRDYEFKDGYEEMRWTASQNETWSERASSILRVLSERVGREQEAAGMTSTECRAI